MSGEGSRCEKNPDVGRKFRYEAFIIIQFASKDAKEMSSRSRHATLVQCVDHNQNRARHCLRKFLRRFHDQLFPLLQNISRMLERRVLMNSSSQLSPHLLIAVSKISRNRREDFLLALFSHLVAVETVARSQSSKLLEAISNGMGDGRFARSSFAVEPQYARCVILGVVDPSSDFVQDFVTGPLQTDFPRVQPRPPNVWYTA
jgi:hypothetical protein